MDKYNGLLNVKRNVTVKKLVWSLYFFHTFTFPTQFHIQLFKVNKLQVVFADLYGFKIYM